MSYPSFINLDADLTLEEKKEFLNEVERRCPVADNMINGSHIIHTIV